MQQLEMSVDSNGQVKCIYTDALDLSEIGYLDVERASHVEFSVELQAWIVEFVDPDGKCSKSFLKRSDALRYEVNEINRSIRENRA